MPKRGRSTRTLAAMEAPARSLETVRRIHGPAGIVVFVALVGIWLVALTGLDTSISMKPIFGTVIPALSGALFLGLYLWRVLQLSPEANSDLWRKWNIESKGVRLALIMILSVVCAGLVAYFVRDAMRNLAGA